MSRRSKRLSLSVSSWSMAESEGSPQTPGPVRLLTGRGAPGFGNHLSMLQVRQLGPPRMAFDLPRNAARQIEEYGLRSNMLW